LSPITALARLSSWSILSMAGLPLFEAMALRAGQRWGLASVETSNAISGDSPAVVITKGCAIRNRLICLEVMRDFQKTVARACEKSSAGIIIKACMGVLLLFCQSSGYLSGCHGVSFRVGMSVIAFCMSPVKSDIQTN
jgi:hypothetical protein